MTAVNSFMMEVPIIWKTCPFILQSKLMDWYVYMIGTSFMKELIPASLRTTDKIVVIKMILIIFGQGQGEP